MNVELKTAEWKDQIFDVFQDHDIRQVFHVPDAGHSRLIELCQKSNSIRTIALTTEEEGIPLAAGAWLGGTLDTSGLVDLDPPLAETQHRVSIRVTDLQ